MSKENLKNDLYQPVEIKNWGFNTFSEKLNGRIAMLGFVLVFFFELLTKEEITKLIK